MLPWDFETESKIVLPNSAYFNVVSVKAAESLAEILIATNGA